MKSTKYTVAAVTPRKRTLQGTFSISGEVLQALLQLPVPMLACPVAAAALPTPRGALHRQAISNSYKL
jgi:hypothetical protein